MDDLDPATWIQIERPSEALQEGDRAGLAIGELRAAPLVPDLSPTAAADELTGSPRWRLLVSAAALARQTQSNEHPLGEEAWRSQAAALVELASRWDATRQSFAAGRRGRQPADPASAAPAIEVAAGTRNNASRQVQASRLRSAPGGDPRRAHFGVTGEARVPSTRPHRGHR